MTTALDTYPMSSVPRPAGPPRGARRAADYIDVDLACAASFGAGVPHEAFEALRREAPVAWHDEQAGNPFYGGTGTPGFWAVTTHRLVTEASRTPSVFSSWLGATLIPEVGPGILGFLRQMMLNMDAPDHTHLRHVLQPIFTPRAVGQLDETVTRNAAEIVDEIVGEGACDLVTSVSAEMPLRVLADLLGMPRSDRHLIFEWSNKLIGLDDPDYGGDPADAMSALTETLAYGKDIADDRRRHPRQDLVSLIATAEVDGHRLSDVEFGMFWLLLIVAGNETTRNSLSGAVVALQEHDKWAFLRDNANLVPAAVEELVRYVSPVLHFRRTATVEVTLGDQTIRAGDKVVLWYVSANRDETVYAEPHRLHLGREPNPHLAFGVGPHVCLGAHLARLQLRAMIAQLLKRLPDLRLDGPVERVHSNFINGIKHLPVAYTPAGET